LDRIAENANIFGSTFEKELMRVLVHGTLHLCGYKDKSDDESVLMRKKENEALSLFADIIL
jgi:rRNA maturation RNase YbeY